MLRTTTATLLSTLVLMLAVPAYAADVTVQLPAGDGFVVEDNTATIERLRVDEATGNISRNGALFVHTTGDRNTFVGEGAGNTSSTGVGRNSAFGNRALYSNTTGVQNSAFGANALRYNTTGGFNSGFGSYALRGNTTGQSNSAFGQVALRSNTTGYSNSALGHSALGDNTTGSENSAFGHSALRSNTTGYSNSSFGKDSLRSNTSGRRNSAFGHNALHSNTTGNFNSAFGQNALNASTTGERNAAFGINALLKNTTGYRNTASGHNTLRENTVGYRNSAFGDTALYNSTTGNGNVAMGDGAGINQTTGSDNIYLANTGVAAESGKIKIGNSAHTEAFIEGIEGNTASGGVAVLINASNELHTLVSSARFKESVRDMGEGSGVLMQLRPVTFLYRGEGGGDGRTREYGLIAEEVAEVAPDLVVRDDEGLPYSVRYHVLAPLMINEMQKQQHTIDTQRQTIAALADRLEHLEERLVP